MRKTTIAIAAMAALGLTACDAVQPYRDLENAEIMEPDSARIVLNADQFPNISVLCVNGVALGTTTRENSPVTELPGLASLCG